MKCNNCGGELHACEHCGFPLPIPEMEEAIEVRDIHIVELENDLTAETAQCPFCEIYDGDPGVGIDPLARCRFTSSKEATDICHGLWEDCPLPEDCIPEQTELAPPDEAGEGE